MPRSNKAASLRASGAVAPAEDMGDEHVNEHGVYVRPESRARTARPTSERGRGYENVPGYKRQSLALSVASLKAPSIAPRQTTSSLLRTSKKEDLPADSAYSFILVLMNKMRFELHRTLNASGQ
jgi:hypothetical protein